MGNRLRRTWSCLAVQIPKVNADLEATLPAEKNREKNVMYSCVLHIFMHKNGMTCILNEIRTANNLLVQLLFYRLIGKKDSLLSVL